MGWRYLVFAATSLHSAGMMIYVYTSLAFEVTRGYMDQSFYDLAYILAGFAIVCVASTISLFLTAKRPQLTGTLMLIGFLISIGLLTSCQTMAGRFFINQITLSFILCIAAVIISFATHKQVKKSATIDCSSIESISDNK